MSYLGDLDNLGDGVGPNYTSWVSVVKSAGGSAVTWPFSSGLYARFYGRPAAQFTASGYARAANAGYISSVAIAQATANNQYVYVLAPDEVAADAPKTMNLAQRAANAIFTTGDRAADYAGLPSLNSVQEALKSTGKSLAWAVFAGVVTWAVIQRIGRGNG